MSYQEIGYLSLMKVSNGQQYFLVEYQQWPKHTGSNIGHNG